METGKPADVILQIVDPTLSLDDRDRAVQTFWDDLTQLELTPHTQIEPLIDKPNGDYRYGLRVKFADPDALVVWVKDLSDRLDRDPVEMRLTCTLDRLRVQAQTTSGEGLLSLLPAIDAILPARQIFQARAEVYALRGGEISPVERANLDLLRYRLDLEPELAESIIQRALGPYRDRQAKLERYREVLNAELERQALPLSDTTKTELRRLYQSLGLSYDDIAPIDEDCITRIQTRLQAETDHLRQQEEVTRLQRETQLQAEAAQQEAAQQQSYGDRYRDEFAGAIAHTLYPSEFDRGRLEQARHDWQIDSEMARAIEREVTDARYGAIDSTSGLDYSRLRQLLWLTQWDAADQETERLILSALSEDMRPLQDNAILRFSCVDLQTLDALWSRYSQGKFGFTAQHQVYVQQERRAGEFLAAVGWREPVTLGGLNLLVRPKAYRDLKFILGAAPQGHLPTWRWGAGSLEGAYTVSEDVVHGVFHDLVEKCLPGLKASAALPPEGA